MDAPKQQVINEPAFEFEVQARARQDQLIKPRGALGKLESIACWFAARQRREIPNPLKPAILVFAADHGVARQGVSAYPASVTSHMLESLGQGVAAINVLARACDADFEAIDVGVNQPSSNSNVHSERIACGTKDLSSGPAMSLVQAQRAIEIGANYARRVIARGANLVLAGEVGIANTTSAACLIAALLQIEPGEIVGHGSGVSDAVLTHKLQVVQTALARRSPSLTPMQILAEFGGFEIAAITGACLEAARRGVPSLLDGFISSSAALVGCAIEPNLRHWLLASHRSAERGHKIALDELDLDPLIDLGMRLGEGTGAAVVVPLLQAAIKLHAEMATFAEAGVPDST